MKSKFITHPQDTGDGFFNTLEAEFFMSFSHPASASDAGWAPTTNPVEIPSTPTLTGEAAQALGSQSGATSTLSMTSGGITINLLFDAAAMAAPASFRAGIQQAASLLTAAISDQITVNIKIDYSGTGGGAAAGPDNGLYESYSSITTDLISKATPGDTLFNDLPTGSSIQGQSSVAVWNAQLKVLGLLGANDTTTDDGSATFTTDINPSLLVGVALHELTHAMGRVPYGSPYSPSPDIFDLFRFISPGVRMFSGASTASAAYFSVDGGSTKLADFGQTSDPSDFLNSGVQGANDPFNEFYTGGTLQTLTAIDKEQLDALGFHTNAPVTTTVIESFGLTKLVEVGNNYFLDSISTGAGPELKYGGSPLIDGEFAGATPIAAEATSTGYEVAWNVGGGQYSVWNTDSSGNYVSHALGATSGSSAALESLEPSFSQDLNGDGVIGLNLPTTVIESFGSTKLVEVGNNYFLDSISTGTGPELQYGGAPVIAGEFVGATPIAAEATSTGYVIAWNVGGGQYSVWNTDSSGNYVSHALGATSGSSAALELLEPSFSQDLNGDGVIGLNLPTTVIESFGSTKLVEVGNNYFLDNVSTGTGPELQYGGVPVVAGEFTGATPIAAEATSTGYEVAWNVGGGQYSVWNTDSSGNYVSHALGATSGSSAALESLEPSFSQDLNGDGVIGIPAHQALSNSDTFVFNPGIGAEIVANVPSPATFELDGFSSVTSSAQLVELLNEAQTGQPQALFQSTTSGHDTVIDLGNQDSITLINVSLATLHASNFIIH